MGKPSLTSLVKRTLTDAFIVDVRRGQNGVLVVDVVMDSPAPIEPGRYGLVPAADMALALKRLNTVEQAALLDKAARRRR